MGESKKKQSKNTALLYHPIFLKHNPDLSHPENPNRLKTIMNYLEQKKITKKPEISLLEPF